MNAADLQQANAIAAAMGKLDKDEASLASGVDSAGMRCKDNSSWINLPKSMHDQFAAMARQHFAQERARLRRAAAQIGLSLDARP